MQFNLNTGLSSAFNFATNLLDRLVKDPAQVQQAQLALQQLEQSGELEQLRAATQVQVAQAATNTAEATRGDAVAADWRPFIGWVCGVALAYDFILRPLLTWGALAWWHVGAPPELDTATLMPLLIGMLGLGTMTTAKELNARKAA